MSASTPPNGLPQSSFRQRAIPYLTKLAHGSTPFIVTFLLIHMSAPALANLGGSSLASQTMILGREYYQTDFGEKYLVLGPIAIHTLSATLRRLLNPSKTPPRPLSSLLSITGYLTTLFLLPVHFSSHRLNPTVSTPPILSVGPAELDYEFIKMGLQTWPWRSWGLYTALVGCVLLHLVDGTNIIWNTNTWLRNTLGRMRGETRFRRQLLAIGTVGLPVLSGIYMISREPLMIFSSLAKRFEAVYMSSFIYRL